MRYRGRSYCSGRVLSMTETERDLTLTEQTTEDVPTSAVFDDLDRLR
jgi:hypothetical protein